MIDLSGRLQLIDTDKEDRKILLNSQNMATTMFFSSFSLNWAHLADSVIESPCPCVNCLSVCAIGCSFFQGLLALRSHDQFQASHWSSIPPLLPPLPPPFHCPAAIQQNQSTAICIAPNWTAKWESTSLSCCYCQWTEWTFGHLLPTRWSTAGCQRNNHYAPSNSDGNYAQYYAQCNTYTVQYTAVQGESTSLSCFHCPWDRVDILTSAPHRAEIGKQGT